MALSRRHLLSLSAAGLLLPAGLARAGTAQRRFLFLFVRGGWDPTWVFTSTLSHDSFFFDEGAREEQIGGIPLVISRERPSVTDFFERFGDTCCVINGLEVRSVTHTQCTRLMLTGTLQPTADWPTLLAAGRDELMPLLVSSGPSFAGELGSGAVRLGTSGQLEGLLDGSAIADPLSSDAVALVDAWLAAQAGDASARFDLDYATSHDRLRGLRALSDELTLAYTTAGNQPTLAERCQPALDCLQRGVCRVAVVEDDGFYGMGWDSHGDIREQSALYEAHFASLARIMEDLATRTGPAGGALLDEVTVVVLSEMGRSPVLNALGGKDHWTTTSAMLLGAGVLGDQVVGAYDERLLGLPISLSTGLVEEGGVALTSAHLGATLLDLGGAPRPAHLADVPALSAVIA